MDCCQCQGIEELFDEDYVAGEVSRFRAKGPAPTTRMLVDALKAQGVEGLTLLDIGGGVGFVQQELLDAGALEATDVEASTAYLAAARAEAQRRGHAGRVSYYHGNFVDVAAEIAPADIVTLDRVICCYNDMETLVSLSTARARKLYGLVYPRDAWWVRIEMAVENLFYRLERNPFRAFFYPARAIDAVVSRSGLVRRFSRRTLAWEVVVYGR